MVKNGQVDTLITKLNGRIYVQNNYDEKRPGTMLSIEKTIKFRTTPTRELGCYTEGDDEIYVYSITRLEDFIKNPQMTILYDIINTNGDPKAGWSYVKN